ncbi:TPA: hypothetical protein HA278_03695 [Candidatus Woesearchaeota archaeon]|nr:hypothetical protein [Candidatus Woesearchaeota archaeon]
MDNKKLGIILICIGVLFLVSLIIFKIQVNNLSDVLMEQSGGTCFLEDGECIHQRSQSPVYFGVVVIGALFSLGGYLFFFDKSQKYAKESHERIVEKLEETKRDEKFEILLKGLDAFEKKFVKAKLSHVLTDLESKKLITRVPEGKTLKIHFKNVL